MATETTVCGTKILVDRSGKGHCWRRVAANDLPANILREIECEILDGGQESCDDYVATNGLHYRW